jgi:hypothetical protein
MSIFYFDLSKTMLVLLESNKKFDLACLFYEISFSKVWALSYYNDILKTLKNDIFYLRNFFYSRFSHNNKQCQIII